MEALQNIFHFKIRMGGYIITLIVKQGGVQNLLNFKFGNMGGNLPDVKFSCWEVWNNHNNTLTNITYYQNTTIILTTRNVRKSTLKRVPLTEKTRKSFFHRSLYIYNKLPYNLRIIDFKNFNKNIKQYVSKNYSLDKVPLAH